MYIINAILSFCLFRSKFTKLAPLLRTHPAEGNKIFNHTNNWKPINSRQQISAQATEIQVKMHHQPTKQRLTKTIYFRNSTTQVIQAIPQILPPECLGKHKMPCNRIPIERLDHSWAAWRRRPSGSIQCSTTSLCWSH